MTMETVEVFVDFQNKTITVSVTASELSHFAASHVNSIVNSISLWFDPDTDGEGTGAGTEEDA